MTDRTFSFSVWATCVVLIFLGLWLLPSCSGGGGSSSKVERLSKPLDVDPSGQGVNIKGQLIAPDILAHASHWPNKLGGVVRFRGRDGKISARTIAKIEHLGNDLALLHLSSPVDPENHFIAPVGEAIKGEPVTIFRHWGREPVGTYISDLREGYLFGWVKKGRLISGDSGGAWYQLQGDQVYFLGNTFRAGSGGRASNAAALLNPKIHPTK